MHQCHCSFRLFAGRSAVPLMTIVAALFFHAAPDGSAFARQSSALLVAKTIVSPLLDAIDQNTRGESEGYAAGVPRHFAWCGGSYKPSENGAPPSDFTAVTGWAQVYPEAGSPVPENPHATITVANAKTYVRLRTSREWILVQDQATDSIAGAHYAADFGTEATGDIVVRALPGGSVSVPGPTIGVNTHFWLMRRGTYEAGSIDGVYVQMDMKTDASSARLVANVGADWWRNATADYVSGFANNPGVGMSNWIELSTEWSTLRFYSGSASQLRAFPPPPLAGPAPEAAPAIVRHRARNPAPCRSVPQD